VGPAVPKSRIGTGDTLLRVLLSISVAVLAVIAVLIAVQTFYHPPDEWSYIVLAPKDEDLIKELNQAGALGLKLNLPDELPTVKEVPLPLPTI
jgi:hypothetical protein